MTSARQQSVLARILLARRHLRDLAVSSYLAGGVDSPLSALLGSSSLQELSRRSELLSTMARTEGSALRRYDQERDLATQDTRDALAALQRAQVAKQEADRRRSVDASLVMTRRDQLSAALQLLQLTTATRAAPGTDIPRLVLDAYRRAVAQVGPRGCTLPWEALAAIGEIESDQGRWQGSQVTTAGDIVPPIIGPALDGQGGTALLIDADHGKWDGDPVYVHAIGPMQFIETTWAVVGRDGNGDGRADPNNIYDAALSAAVYLCAAAPPAELGTDAGLRQAFYAYNHSALYAEEAVALTRVYTDTQPG